MPARRSRAERTAASVDAAVEALRREEIFVTRIDAVEVSRASSRRSARGARARAAGAAQAAGGLHPPALGDDRRGGCRWSRAWRCSETQEEDAGFRETILAVRAHGEGVWGWPRRWPATQGAFDALYVNMVAAGEGRRRPRRDPAAARDVHRDVRQAARAGAGLALTYPAAVLAIAAVVVAAVLWKVVPAFTSLFEGLGATLPLPTRVGDGCQRRAHGRVPVLLLGGGAGALWLRRFYRTPRGRRLVDRALLGAPALGTVLRKVAVARFCRTLATLLSAGVPILDALEITARTAATPSSRAPC